MEKATTRERVLMEDGIKPEKAFRKAVPRKPLHFSPLPRVKVQGALPGPDDESEHQDPALEVDPDVTPGVVFSKHNYCQSPTQLPGMQKQIQVQGLELGLTGMNEMTQQHMPPRLGGPPSRNLPKIYLGDNAPTPRWLIRPVQSDGNFLPPRTSRLPPLGQLRWEFEPGPSSQHGQDESRLREYAYQYLQNALCDPIVREELRQVIWNSRFQKNVANVDDPLPVPPPPPHFKDQRPSDYVNLRPPISPSNPDDYYFVYPGYERPSLAARALESPTRPQSSHAGSYARRSSMAESDSTRTRASTSSSVSTNAKDCLPEYYHHELSEDHQHHIRPSSQSDSTTLAPAETKSSTVAKQNSDAITCPNKTRLDPSGLLTEPPKRARGQPNTYAEIPTLDELSGADADAEADLPPRKKRAVGRKVSTRSKDTWSPTQTSSSDAFSEEDLPAPKVSKVKASRKKNKAVKKRKKAAKRR